MNDRIALPDAATFASRIDALRRQMARDGLAAVLIPSADPHLSEYLPERWQERQWLSGFTGSVGTLVVTADFAGVWVDSRYWTQAEAQLSGTGVRLMKMTGGQQTAPHVGWLAQNVPAGGVVAVDGAVLGVAAARAVRCADGARHRATHRRRSARCRMARASRAVGRVGVRTRRAGKLAQVRAAMDEKGAQSHFISTLDDLAWIFNLRGGDVSYNPVFVAHALIGLDDATIFVGDGKVPDALKASLARDGVRIAPYADALKVLASLAAGSTLLMIDPRRITHGLLEQVPSSVTVVESVNPSTFAKSRKTAAEAEHIRATMEQDGAALAEFFAWFEDALARGERITELTIDEKLTAARMRRPGFVTLSFVTIAGFNANGAMPHYRATQASHSVIEGDGLLLIDSGGQYLSGTTDITRVVPIGNITAEHKRDFTVVLKGTMALSRARFPRGIRSPMLDSIARADLGRRRGLRPRHGPRRRLLPERARRPGGHFALRARRAVDGNGRGHDYVDRAGHLSAGQVGHPHRKSGDESGGGQNRIRRFSVVRNADLVPDRYALHRSISIARGRARVAQRVHETVWKRVSPHVSGEAKAWLEKRTQAI